MKYLLFLFATVSLAMDNNTLEPINHFDSVPDEITEMILLQVGNQENPATKYSNFKELLKCKRVCKQWIPIVDAIYTLLLNQEKKRIVGKTDEKSLNWKQRECANDCLFSSALEVDSFLYIYDHFKDKTKELNNPHTYVLYSGHEDYYHALSLNNEGPLEPYFLNINTPPLIKCVDLGSINVITMLIELGAGICTPDADGKTALQLAMANDKTEIAKKLIAAAAKLTYVRQDSYNCEELIRLTHKFSPSKKQKH